MELACVLYMTLMPDKARLRSRRQLELFDILFGQVD
jgi:hypothetical protein